MVAGVGNMSEYALWDSWDSGFLIVSELLCGYLFVFDGWDSGWRYSVHPSAAMVGGGSHLTVDTEGYP